MASSGTDINSSLNGLRSLRDELRQLKARSSDSPRRSTRSSSSSSPSSSSSSSSFSSSSSSDDTTMSSESRRRVAKKAEIAEAEAARPTFGVAPSALPSNQYTRSPAQYLKDGGSSSKSGAPSSSSSGNRGGDDNRRERDDAHHDSHRSSSNAPGRGDSSRGSGRDSERRGSDGARSSSSGPSRRRSRSTSSSSSTSSSYSNESRSYSGEDHNEESYSNGSRDSNDSRGEDDDYDEEEPRHSSRSSAPPRLGPPLPGQAPSGQSLYGRRGGAGTQSSQQHPNYPSPSQAGNHMGPTEPPDVTDRYKSAAASTQTQGPNGGQHPGTSATNHVGEQQNGGKRKKSKFDDRDEKGDANQPIWKRHSKWFIGGGIALAVVAAAIVGFILFKRSEKKKKAGGDAGDKRREKETTSAQQHPSNDTKTVAAGAEQQSHYSDRRLSYPAQDAYPTSGVHASSTPYEYAPAYPPDVHTGRFAYPPATPTPQQQPGHQQIPFDDAYPTHPRSATQESPKTAYFPAPPPPTPTATAPEVPTPGQPTPTRRLAKSPPFVRD